MKYSLFIFSILQSLGLISQKISSELAVQQYKTNVCVSEYSIKQTPRITTVSEAAEWLTNNLSNLKSFDVHLKLNYVNESPGGVHYSFHQVFNGVEIYQTEVKLNLDKQHNLRSVLDNSENTDTWKLNTSSCDGRHMIAVINGQPVLCTRSIENGHTEVLRAGGEVVYSRDLHMYAAAPDSLVSGKVFNPDPLTTAQQNYASPYNDNGDATNAQLDAELKTVNFKAEFNGTHFSLQNQYVRVVDNDAPNIAPVTSTTPQFYYNRSQPGFEDVNAFYHINMQRDRVNSLGFTTANFLVDVDVHAFGGADNSAFSFFSSPPNIKFGTGGVDDAEDADVLVHEYGHFISYNAANGSNVGSERNSLDEGFSDYLAGTYSDNISSFKRNEIFSWDGHNEYWNGRVLNTSRKYPADLQSSIYKNAEMWSAALWDIYNEIGRNATDSLILQAHYSYAQNMSMADGAVLLLDADSLLTNGYYHCPVYKHLYLHGFVAFEPNNPCGVSSLSNENKLPVSFLQSRNEFTLLNPEEYTLKVEVLTVSGQVVYTFSTSSVQHNFNNLQASSGLYLVRVIAENSSRTFKWAKIQ